MQQEHDPFFALRVTQLTVKTVYFAKVVNCVYEIETLRKEDWRILVSKRDLSAHTYSYAPLVECL